MEVLGQVLPSVGPQEDDRARDDTDGSVIEELRIHGPGSQDNTFEVFSRCRHWYCINKKIGCGDGENTAGKIQSFFEVYSPTTG